MQDEPVRSTTAAALAAAGDRNSAVDIQALDDAAEAADRKLRPTRRSLVERLIYGPAPATDELQRGGRLYAGVAQPVPGFEAAMDTARAGHAFTADGKLSPELRRAVAEAGTYGITVPREHGGLGKTYLDLAHLEEALAANGHGPLAVEISGQLTIGAGSLLGYGTAEQRAQFLPLVAKGTLMAFALTEVGTGVNAKKIEAYVEADANGDYRLFADGPRSKLWITSATHGNLAAIAARIGRGGRELGLFLTRLPAADVGGGAEDWEFRCEPSGVAAFTANINTRLHFRNYPIPARNRVPGDGVEVLFYSLRLGRCMLAAMSAGYQRMLARDAAEYARERLGVGGPVIRHELPRLALARMLGGSLQARALACLALAQDADGVDLAGLRDITKSAAAETAGESMRDCEHVLGGRAFDSRSRVNAARPNLHLFGVVEGEDDMIRMGMVRDVTGKFVATYLSPLLSHLEKANVDAAGTPRPVEHRLLRVSLRTALRHPARAAAVLARILGSRAAYQLLGWMLRNCAGELGHWLQRLVPTASLQRYKALPPELAGHARYAERELRKVRWRHLRLTLVFQLELTSAQIALQRLGRQIEVLVSMLALCHHAATQDPSQWRVAHLRCLVLREEVDTLRAGLRTRNLRRLRQATAAVAEDILAGSASMFHGLAAEPYAHPFKDPGPTVRPQ